MPATVSLQDVVEAMDMLHQECEAFLDPESGEIVNVTEEDQIRLNFKRPELLQEWEREQIALVRDAIESDRYLRLPDSFDIHEWSIMERFCLSLTDHSGQDQLLDAIRGRGAFRSFRRTVERLDLLERWYDYRHAAFEEIAREWLEENRIPYK